MVPPEEKRRLYVAVPPSRRDYKPCRFIAIPSSPGFAYKSTIMADVDESDTAEWEQHVYMYVAITDHVVVVVVKFLARTRS